MQNIGSMNSSYRANYISAMQNKIKVLSESII